MLLDVEKQVATFAGGVEVRHVAQPLQLDARLLGCQILAKSANVIRRTCIAMRGNHFTRLDHVPACDLAIEAQTHKSSGSQSGQQCSPSCEGVGQMMQHSN